MVLYVCVCVCIGSCIIDCLPDLITRGLREVFLSGAGSIFGPATSPTQASGETTTSSKFRLAFNNKPTWAAVWNEPNNKAKAQQQLSKKEENDGKVEKEETTASIKSLGNCKLPRSQVFANCRQNKKKKQTNFPKETTQSIPVQYHPVRIGDQEEPLPGFYGIACFCLFSERSLPHDKVQYSTERKEKTGRKGEIEYKYSRARTLLLLLLLLLVMHL